MLLGAAREITHVVSSLSRQTTSQDVRANNLSSSWGSSFMAPKMIESISQSGRKRLFSELSMISVVVLLAGGASGHSASRPDHNILPQMGLQKDTLSGQPNWQRNPRLLVILHCYRQHVSTPPSNVVRDHLDENSDTPRYHRCRTSATLSHETIKLFGYRERHWPTRYSRGSLHNYVAVYRWILPSWWEVL